MTFFFALNNLRRQRQSDLVNPLSEADSFLLNCWCTFHFRLINSFVCCALGSVGVLSCHPYHIRAPIGPDLDTTGHIIWYCYDRYVIFRVILVKFKPKSDIPVSRHGWIHGRFFSLTDDEVFFDIIRSFIFSSKQPWSLKLIRPTLKLYSLIKLPNDIYT